MLAFKPLSTLHFPLLLKWLEKLHVKKWLDPDILWTRELIEKIYTPYTKGHKILTLKDNTTIKKPIHGFIIEHNEKPIGYIQYYNKHDFPSHHGYESASLPESVAGLDIFIGEENKLGQGIGTSAIKLFIDEHVFKHYRYAFSDLEYENISAVRAFEKAGFDIIKRDSNMFWMMATKRIVRLSLKEMMTLELLFRKYFLPQDHLWIFGSRANLEKKGGDLDLYIETNISTLEDAVAAKMKFSVELIQQLFDGKIDIVLNTLQFPDQLPIYDIAKIEGAKLL